MSKAVTMSGSVKPVVSLEQKEGKWRTKVTWVLPADAPVFPATLDSISGLSALPRTEDALNDALFDLLAAGKPCTINLTLDKVPKGAEAPPPPPPPSSIRAAPPAAPSSIRAPPPAAAAAAPAPSPSAGPAKKGGESVVVLAIQAEEGEPPGISLDEKLMVTKILPGSVVEGKVELGDVIISLNKVKVSDKSEFWQRWNRALPEAALEVNRSSERGQLLAAALLPEGAEKLIIRKADHEYLLKPIDCSSGRPLGLGLETLVNKVVVIRIVPGTAGAEACKLWDTISAVDRIRVSDANVAKHLIRDRSGKFEALLERPQTKELMGLMEKALTAKRSLNMANESEDWAKFAGPVDVAVILEKAIPARRSIVPAKAILRPRGGSVSTAKLSVAVREQPAETLIVSDTDPNKALRKVPKM